MLVPLIGLPVLWLRTDALAFGLFLGGSLAAVAVATSAHHATRQRRGDEPDDRDEPGQPADGGGAP
jgi:hypothetical protein